MTARSTDGEIRLPVNRTIPLWGVWCVVGGIALQAVSVYYGQQSQSEKLTRLETATASLNAKLDSMSTTQSDAKLKDLEHDFKLSSLTNRIAALEAVMQRQLPGTMTQQSQGRGK